MHQGNGAQTIPKRGWKKSNQDLIGTGFHLEISRPFASQEKRDKFRSRAAEEQHLEKGKPHRGEGNDNA